ncbi:hypothetical protein DFH05DRAFT_1528140 [Lentinula detonsa]|uniref:S-adenosyl-L-methionine-dependent methyltransferase n=1 Tax=Lentinula detonsa TaxID=2804962 RepID=A0A9W8TUK8_9AGAR|nr:hypothetical protein DFH05DRAFT_1528140 [Lentinula detonsa]KAJ3988169.1 hypothetical protein F5890DRAFT_1550821 [Lentinula detonsa]
MREQPSFRYYASKQYLLPADNIETNRLNAQHNIVNNALNGRLYVAPTSLTTGDRVLESAAGSGIWALEFFEQNRADGIVLDIESIDISSAQFPCAHPPQIHFSVNSIVNLPNEWDNVFVFAHQRLLVLALNDCLWHSAVSELLRVIRPGGWVELVEIEARDFRSLYDETTVIGNLSVYLPEVLKKAGFVDVVCETKYVPIGGEEDDTPHKVTDIQGYSSELWREVWMGMKGPVMDAGKAVKTVEEYEALVQDSATEWKTSKEAYTTLFVIVARKPDRA